MLNRPEPGLLACLWGTLLLAGPGPRPETQGGEVTESRVGPPSPLHPCGLCPLPLVPCLSAIGYLELQEIHSYYFGLSLLIKKGAFPSSKATDQKSPLECKSTRTASQLSQAARIQAG